MSNSKLATYINLSPNRTAPRFQKIKGVAVHCTAGGRNFTAKQIVSLSHFTTYNATRGSSCHYAIGGDGSIAQGCLEENRAWCTSSQIDHYLVTIEVASDATGICKANDAALESLIRLLADICRRNGIPKLLWKGDKALMGKWSEQNMVCHRWTAAKSCPGDYLYGLHGEIAARTNKLLSESDIPDSREKEVEDMTIEEFLNGLNSEQIALLESKLAAYRAGRPEPEWSEKDGAFARAKRAGVMDGKRPEDFVKRDELAAVLDRTGVLNA